MAYRFEWLKGAMSVGQTRYKGQLFVGGHRDASWYCGIDSDRWYNDFAAFGIPEQRCSREFVGTQFGTQAGFLVGLDCAVSTLKWVGGIIRWEGSTLPSSPA